MNKWLLFKVPFFILSLYSMPLYALSWQSLWFTQDQQAQTLMDKGQYDEAQHTFKRDDWQAAAAYRAGDYKHAAELYRAMENESGYYNLGNALAHMGQYEQAIAAYNKALAIDPDHQDALHNRNLIKEQLKKDKQQARQEKKQSEQNDKQQNKQQPQSSEKKSGSQEQNNAQSQSAPDNQMKKQDKQEQEKQQRQEQAQKNRHSESKEEKQSEKENKQDEHEPQSQDKRPEKAQQNDPNKHAQNSSASQSDRETQQAKEQWLRVIPDDPGGLLRQKFLRDHLRRQHR